MTLRAKSLSKCTADDITPIDERLRADCVDYLAYHGRSTQFTGPDSCTMQHLLRLCGNVDGSGATVNSDGITTIPEGSFAGHFATPPAIERIRAEIADLQERAQLRVRSGDLRALSPGDEQRVADALHADPHQHHEILESVAAELRGSLGPYPARCGA